MKIFVTGATGFIGKNLATKLVEKGYEVTCGVRSFNKLGALLDKVKAVYIDLEKKDTIQNALKKEKPDVVYHCAALVDNGSLPRLRRVNVEGTENLFYSCLAEGIKKIIYLSSCAVVSGNSEVPLTEDLPYKATNPYGQSKIEAEKLAIDYRKSGLKIAILRPCFVYGECEPHMLGLLTLALRKRILPIFGRGDKKMHLVSVENVVDVMLLCLSEEKAFEGTYFIADKEALSSKEVLNYVAEVLGAKPPFVLPQSVAVILSKFPFIGRRVSLFLKDRVYSIERLKRELGYVPRVSIYDGLKRAVLSCKR